MPDLGTRLLQVADALTARIQANWNPVAPDVVTRKYVERSQLAPTPGRRVWVVPTAARLVEAATRGPTWLKEFKIGLRCLEYYSDPGKPLDAWVDQRVAFVGQRLHDDLLLVADPATFLLGTFYVPEDALPEVTEIADAELILNHKAFWAEVEFTFRGIEP
jgi:hypothetical protein